MIVLQILKIIGIVAACIVGLILVLVLLVLLVPLRYRLMAAGQNSDIDASFRITWFLGLAKAQVSYSGKKVEYKVTIAGRKLLGGILGENEVEVLQEELKKEETKSNAKKYAEVSRQLEKAVENAEKAETAKIEKAEQKIQEKEEKKQEKEEEKERKKEEAKEKTFLEKLQDRMEKLRELKKKGETIKKIWEAKTTKRALRHLKIELFHILNHIKPRKMAGTIRFGMSDPADTALIYGSAGFILETMSKGELVITPDFYEQGIELDLAIKGRFFLGYMILCFIRLYLDRDIQKVIKVTRRFING